MIVKWAGSPVVAVGHIIMIIIICQQLWLSGSSTGLSGHQPGVAPQAALIAVRLTKLVAPSNGSSMARLYRFLSFRLSAPHVKSSMIESIDRVWLTGVGIML